MTNADKQMTNAALNLAIAKLVWVDDEWNTHKTAGHAITVDGLLFKTFSIEDWSDLMPLVVEHEIELIRTEFIEFDEVWTARHVSWVIGTSESGYEVTHKDPQRALAECLLKVLQEKNND